MIIEDYLERFALSTNEYKQLEETKYMVYLRNSNEFSKVYTMLDNDPSLEIDDADLNIKEKVSTIEYSNDEVKYSLKADLIKDTYYLIIEENIYA